MPTSRARPYLLISTAAAVTIASGAALVGLARGNEPAAVFTEAPSVPPSRPAASGTPTVAPAAKPPAGLPVIAYAKGPSGLPADPEPKSVVPITEALRPERKVALYDAPGGTPRAFLPPRISGLRVLAPIVARADGWVAVLVPAANRRIGWVPPGGWETDPLRDQLLVDLSERRLTWQRDGAERGRWTVAIGTRRTPTPLGRTFVMGRTGTSGPVYAGLDALVLGSVPEEPEKMAASLQKAHTGIHAWTDSSVFGDDVSNGCVRTPAGVQDELLDQLDPGTPVVVTA